MKAVIHIGDQKCGSTAIQRFLRAYSYQLSRSGIATIESTRVRVSDLGLGALSDSRQPLAEYAHSRDLPTTDTGIVRAHLKSALTSELREKKHSLVVFSWEALLTMHECDVERVMTFLAPLFDSIDLVCFLRRQDRKMVSSYWTRLRNRGATDRNVLFSENGKPLGVDYLKCLRTWSKYVPKANTWLVNYDQIADSTSRFCDLIGVSMPPDYEPMSANVSPSAQAQEVVRQFNIHWASCKPYSEIPQRIRQRIAEILPGEKCRPPRKYVQDYYSHFRRNNIEMNRMVRGVEGDFFDDDFNEYPESDETRVLENGEAEYWIRQAAIREGLVL